MPWQTISYCIWKPTWYQSYNARPKTKSLDFLSGYKIVDVCFGNFQSYQPRAANSVPISGVVNAYLVVYSKYDCNQKIILLLFHALKGHDDGSILIPSCNVFLQSCLSFFKQSIEILTKRGCFRMIMSEILCTL